MTRRWWLAALVIVVGGCGDDDRRVARGWVEGREVDVGAMTAGRLSVVRVQEGDTVTVGDTIALISRDATLAEADVARGRMATAAARLRELERGTRAEDIAAARAELAGVDAELEHAQRELARLEPLEDAGGISQQTIDDARTAVVHAAARREVVRERLARLRAGATREQLEAARAELAAARAAFAAAESVAEELVVVAPVSGPVLVRAFEEGEVVGAGAPIVTVLAGDERWVRVWVPQEVLQDVRVGSTARVSIDGGASGAVTARVASIATRAEFTPRVALTEDERADLMYAVRLDVDESAPALRVGVPVEARFEVADD